MSKVVVSQFMSVDGVVEDPAGIEGSGLGPWTFDFDRGPEGDQFKLDEAMASEALLLGRVTYESFAEAWPAREGDFAGRFNRMPKYVVTTTLETLDWSNSTPISRNVPEQVAALKERHGGDIMVNGSVQLVQTLAAHDLVDEYRLMVFPVVLGRGKRLFASAEAGGVLRLTGTRTVGPDRVLILTYETRNSAMQNRSSRR
jgi:dihydrofolate reductase